MSKHLAIHLLGRFTYILLHHSQAIGIVTNLEANVFFPCFFKNLLKKLGENMD